MSVREQILKAIDLYKRGSYDIKMFCNVFGSLYFYSSGGYLEFNEYERKYLDKIGFVSERLTSSTDDLRRYPLIFYSEQQAKTIIDKILISFMCED